MRAEFFCYAKYLTELDQLFTRSNVVKEVISTSFMATTKLPCPKSFLDQQILVMVAFSLLRTSVKVH